MIRLIRSSRPAAPLMLAAGLAVVAVYLALRALHVLGQPTVIGGGMILLLGYVLAVVGLLWLITNIARGHARGRRGPAGQTPPLRAADETRSASNPGAKVTVDMIGATGDPLAEADLAAAGGS